MPSPRAAIALAFNKRNAVELQAKYDDPDTPSRLSRFPRTPEQAAFIAEATNSSRPSILLNAVAGSGKSHTLLDFMLTSRDKFDLSWSAATCNAIGHRAWASRVGKRLKVSTGKSFEILRELNKSGTLDTAPSQFGDVLKLISLAKTFGIIPSTAKTPRYQLTPDEPEAWTALADLYDLEFSPELLHQARTVLTTSIKAGFEGTIDFDDQLYLTTAYAASSLPKHATIIIDEAQDLSAIQHTMLAHMLAPGGQLIAAGDPRQSIYGFRGALTDSLAQLTSKFALRERPLSVCFRCARSVLREAQTIVPQISWPESAPEGTVTNLAPKTPLSDLPRFILCRNTGPLITVALALLAERIPATVLGRDIGTSLISFMEKIIGGKKTNMSLDAFIPRMDEHIRAWIEARPGRAASLNDKRQAILALAQSATDTDSTKRLIRTLYSDDADALVTLSTIHKAKGAEHPNVLFLDPHLIPSRFASQPWQFEQETNLRYVAITRAQENLIFGTTADILGSALDHLQDDSPIDPIPTPPPPKPPSPKPPTDPLDELLADIPF